MTPQTKKSRDRSRNVFFASTVANTRSSTQTELLELASAEQLWAVGRCLLFSSWVSQNHLTSKNQDMRYFGEK